MATYRNIAGTWKSGVWWRNIAGTWKKTSTYRNIAGTWKNVSSPFTPDGGGVTADGIDNADATLNSSVPATWTYTGGGAGGSVNLASGGTSTSITFSVTSISTGGGTTGPRSRTWNVTGTANGVTRTFTVTCNASGNQ